MSLILLFGRKQETLKHIKASPQHENLYVKQQKERGNKRTEEVKLSQKHW